MAASAGAYWLIADRIHQHRQLPQKLVALQFGRGATRPSHDSVFYARTRHLFNSPLELDPDVLRTATPGRSRRRRPCELGLERLVNALLVVNVVATPLLVQALRRAVEEDVDVVVVQQRVRRRRPADSARARRR